MHHIGSTWWKKLLISWQSESKREKEMAGETVERLSTPVLRGTEVCVPLLQWDAYNGQKL